MYTFVKSYMLQAHLIFRDPPNGHTTTLSIYFTTEKHHSGRV